MPKPDSPEKAFADLVRRKATQARASRELLSNTIEERFAARVAAIAKDRVTEKPRSMARGRRKPLSPEVTRTGS
jgi:hypothetical protein